jgi:chromate reductase, NAD(P)H dehydrogenase (quinone)
MKKISFVLIMLLCLFSKNSLFAATKVLAFAASTRTDSFNKKLVKEAADYATQIGSEVTYIDLKHYPIPLYDGDLEDEIGMPDNARFLRALMIESDAIFIASPDYNGSYPPLLKNLLDWASRNGESGGSMDAYKNKKIALMCASTGASGGIKGLVHLREILKKMGAKVTEGQVAVPKAQQAFNGQGRLLDQQLIFELQQLVEATI